MKRMLFILTTFGTVTQIFSKDYYVDTRSGLIVRAEPTTKSKKIGLLKHLSKFPSRKEGPIEKIGDKNGPWLLINFKGLSGWVYGGFASEKPPNVVGMKLKLSTFLDANIEFGVNISNAILGENPHGFAFLRREVDISSKIKYTCELPISGGNDGYECNSVLEVSAEENQIRIRLSGQKCLNLPKEHTDLCLKSSAPVSITCFGSREFIEQSYSTLGAIYGNIQSCQVEP